MGTPVRAYRWDLSYERLMPRLGIVLEFMPHRSGDCYAIATADGVLDVLATETVPFATVEDFVSAIAAGGITKRSGTG